MNSHIELDCPLCNGLQQIEESCSVCGGALKDGGLLENFFGPYSPYEEVDFELKGFKPEQAMTKCIHLLYCPSCGRDQRVAIEKIPIE